MPGAGRGVGTVTISALLLLLLYGLRKLNPLPWGGAKQVRVQNHSTIKIKRVAPNRHTVWVSKSSPPLSSGKEQKQSLLGA